MFFIRGIEVSQSIQHFRADQHLTDPADRGPDNSLKLVAGKAAWSRVYVETDTAGESVTVTGTLEVAFTILNELFGTPPTTLSPQGISQISAQHLPDYVTTRSSMGQTLNFVIPAPLMRGPLVLHATVTGSGGGQTATFDLHISPTLQQTMKVRAISVGYNGPNPANPATNLVVPAPGLTNLQNTAAWALKVMPIASTAIYEVASTIVRNSALTGTATNGGCTTDWVNLNAAIATAKTADGNKSGYFYYGLIASGFPNTSNNAGCESSGVGSGFDGGLVAFAHELGHYCGRPHAPCGSVGTSADPNYPAYEPYDSPAARVASIGEYGLDIAAGAVPTPNSARDYMSYCGPGWISIYGHQVLCNNDALNPEEVGLADAWWKHYLRYDPWWWLHYKPDPPPYWMDPETIREFPAPMHKVISVIGIAHPDGRVEVLSVTRSEVISTQLAGRNTDLRAVLHGARGRELAAGIFVQARAQACGCECGGGEEGPALVQAFIPDVAEGTALSIQKGKETLWKQAAKKGKIMVSAPSVRPAENNEWVIRWKSAVPGGAQDTWVRVSADEGKTWTSKATGIRDTKVTLDGRHLPAGKLLVEVIVHDGFRSVRSKPVPFENSALAPVPTVLYPEARPEPYARDTLCLWGSVACQPGQTPEDFRYEWLLDDKRVGEGLQVFTTVPPGGKHRCEFRVKNAAGELLSSASAEFTSKGRRSR